MPRSESPRHPSFCVRVLEVDALAGLERDELAAADAAADDRASTYAPASSDRKHATA